MERLEEVHTQEVEQLKSAHAQEVERLQTELVSSREELRMELAQMHMGKFSAMATELSHAHKVSSYIIDNVGRGHPHKSCYHQSNHEGSNHVPPVFLSKCSFLKSAIFKSLSMLSQHFCNIKP